MKQFINHALEGILENLLGFSQVCMKCGAIRFVALCGHGFHCGCFPLSFRESL